MLSYDGVKQNPEQFLACTSLTVEEFDILLPSFAQAWNAYVKKNYVNSGGGKPKIPHITDKLFFILFYYKVYPIQAAMGAIFGMSQGQVSFWVGALSIVLQSTLGIARCLPNRRPRQLKEALEACGAYNLIIDGTERERQRPSEPQAQKDYYSGKKKAHTYNNIVIVDRDTRTVEYLSQTYEGTWHDKAICDEEQYTFLNTQHAKKIVNFKAMNQKVSSPINQRRSRAMVRFRLPISSSIGQYQVQESSLSMFLLA